MVIKDNFNNPNEINITQGGNVSVTDYFNLFTELCEMGHIDSVFLRAKSNFNGNLIKTLEIVPKESLKKFSQSGGFI